MDVLESSISLLFIFTNNKGLKEYNRTVGNNRVGRGAQRWANYPNDLNQPDPYESSSPERTRI
nr:hypothetical protein Itr_chr13CG04290 [Ipomoea trifida]GMD73939.1 hypothetical protein Iba_chr13aCG0550 [Ipomoea batatas]GMD76575.1 hypothetical protein Iba_chr13bCG11510 [Ipomoea batatas]GMD77440.1 hypothetical protein Iba_chr13cCG3350 [Ipomoea batatas]GMD79129.1 hypothetical protein Iba_chr13dCG0850 [Ipomoea batatas]